MRDEYVEEEQEQEMTENQDILSEDLLDELRRLAENLNEFDKGINPTYPRVLSFVS